MPEDLTQKLKRIWGHPKKERGSMNYHKPSELHPSNCPGCTDIPERIGMPVTGEISPILAAISAVEESRLEWACHDAVFADLGIALRRLKGVLERAKKARMAVFPL